MGGYCFGGQKSIEIIGAVRRLNQEVPEKCVFGIIIMFVRLRGRLSGSYLKLVHGSKDSLINHAGGLDNLLEL